MAITVLSKIPTQLSKDFIVYLSKTLPSVPVVTVGYELGSRLKPREVVVAENFSPSESFHETTRQLASRGVVVYALVTKNGPSYPYIYLGESGPLGLTGVVFKKDDYRSIWGTTPKEGGEFVGYEHSSLKDAWMLFTNHSSIYNRTPLQQEQTEIDARSNKLIDTMLHESRRDRRRRERRMH
jgi:hypothetical protein